MLALFSALSTLWICVWGWFILSMVLCTQHGKYLLQVIVVNYEDRHTTMEAPDEDDESSYM